MADVRAVLEGMLRLQELDSSLAQVDAALGRLPGRVAEIEKSLGSAEQALAFAKGRIQEQLKGRRSHEQDIDQVKTQISRHQDQLMQVKTNEQYRALNKEIATERGKIEEIEERILLGMERIDELNREVAQRERALAEERTRVEAEKTVLARERQDLEKERAGLDGERKVLVSGLPAEALTMYGRIADQRGGIAVAVVTAETCSACRVRCRPQALAEARNFERIVQCESCRRILVVRSEPPREAQATAGA
jgi:predicted  nucleic acid-binding Zn-ribbon protein